MGGQPGRGVGGRAEARLQRRQAQRGANTHCSEGPAHAPDRVAPLVVQLARRVVQQALGGLGQRRQVGHGGGAEREGQAHHPGQPQRRHHHRCARHRHLEQHQEEGGQQGAHKHHQLHRWGEQSRARGVREACGRQRAGGSRGADLPRAATTGLSAATQDRPPDLDEGQAWEELQRKVRGHQRSAAARLACLEQRAQRAAAARLRHG